MNYSDIKSDIYDHLDQLKENAYPEDLITELADSAVPIYYSEIISDWQEMPSEFNDSWQQIADSDWVVTANITSLMAVDLCTYYQAEYHRIYAEIMHDQEQLESESENA